MLRSSRGEGFFRVISDYLPTRESGERVVCPLSNICWETSVSPGSKLSVKVRFRAGSLVPVLMILLGSVAVGCLFIC